MIMILVGLCAGVALAQQKVEREFQPLTKNEVEFLGEKMGANKRLLPEFEKTIYHALAYFPELEQTHIKFKYQNIKTTLNARPTILSLLFKKKENRRYIVRINSSKRDSSIQLSKVSYNAQIGVLAHEFSHFIDYSEKGIWGILKRLASYTNKKSKARFEKEIDQMTIERGLGWQLHDWAHTVLYDSNASKKYKKLKREIYLTPGKIRDYLASFTPEVQPEFVAQRF
ncbi:hypothetical protein [Plebeiibacterium marinum]|uniref:Uncharacterized protein n=1 Tax=Plebeiibacterium marinum TaxID=2992111 RepID=A0AAE3SKH1_9BACT|nr:hypothetical protein [Plebeiobacterium marinum]MCW3806498.1 hypothetical protein [Plebeiobacterium marinum]